MANVRLKMSVNSGASIFITYLIGFDWKSLIFLETLLFRLMKVLTISSLVGGSKNIDWTALMFSLMQPEFFELIIEFGAWIIFMKY